MSDATDPVEDGEDETAEKGGKGMLIGIVLAVLFGGGGFFAAYSGMLPGTGGSAEAPAEPEPEIMIAKRGEITSYENKKIATLTTTKATF